MKKWNYFFSKEFIEEFEFRRKIFHIIIGVITLSILKFNLINQDYFEILLLLFLIIGLPISIFSRIYKIPFVTDLLRRFERKKYLSTFPGKGAFFYVAGVLFTIVFFDEGIALASIMILILGDTSAHLIGKYYGKTRLSISKTKLLEGTIAGIIIGTLGAMFFVEWKMALFGSIISMIVEAVEIKYVPLDDNLTVPISAGIAMTLFGMI